MVNKTEDNDYCWQCIPCTYDNYKVDPNDRYKGNIFGRLTNFESPHRLYRRFHSNYCKALMMASLSDYKLKDDEDFMSLQISEISAEFQLDIIGKHNSLVLMIGAVETFLRDSFISILENIYPDKIRRDSIEDFVRKKYSFQNLDSITSAYGWLCPEFKKDEIYIDLDPVNFKDKIDLYPYLKEMLGRRHRIVHESYYYKDLNNHRFDKYAYLCLAWADRFDSFLEDNNYYSKIEEAFDKRELR